jgi:hypothetical protein
MRRTRAANNGSTVGLFPFLAVLLCTVGALIVLLVVISHQARAVATENARKQAALGKEEREAIEKRREMLRWRIEEMEGSRKQTAEELRRARLELSHHEDYIRRLKEEMERLASAAEQLKKTDQSTAFEREKAEGRLGRLREQMAAAAARLEKARDKASQAEPSYAIIPYEGVNKTRRRPIYIECRADAVVLQPEGITLRVSDFEGPLGPGNPLAAALRAAREYIAAHQPPHEIDEPYPLLLVRPDGIAAYYKVREAIESWGPDFGYELIGGDWTLDIPPPDAQLALAERAAVEQGRIYQRRLALAAPSRYGRSKPVYGSSPTQGGFVRLDGGGGLGGDGDGQNEGFGRHGHGGNGNEEGIGDQGFGGNHQFRPGAHAGTGTAESGERRAESQSPLSHGGHAGGSQGAGAGDSQGAGAGGSQGTGTSQGTGGGAGSARPGANSLGGSSASGGSASGSSSGGPRFGAPHGKRGRNWALPDSAGKSIPLSRPVRVLCRPNELVLLVGGDMQKSEVVPLEGPTQNAVDAFVSTLWTHMETWGIAGSGMYWRPILILQIEPGGERRAQDLRQLLQDSGLAVENADGRKMTNDGMTE